MEAEVNLDNNIVLGIFEWFFSFPLVPIPEQQMIRYTFGHCQSVKKKNAHHQQHQVACCNSLVF